MPQNHMAQGRRRCKSMASLNRQYFNDQAAGSSQQAETSVPMQKKFSEEGWTPVTVDMRALIDKVLARYPGKLTVFRELLQNADDAESHSAEIHLETAAFLGSDPQAEAGMTAREPTSPDLETTHVTQWTFKNNGKPFGKNDWNRLPKIALGNPSEQKVGAFGVGFYNLFSVTEHPYVSSADKEMKFSWKDETQLYYRFGDSTQTATRDPWTTFKIPLRKGIQTPRVSELIEFLASSITFMVHLRVVTVFLDDRRVGRINKSLGEPQDIPIPTELERSSTERIMVMRSVQQYPITIEISLPRDKTRMFLAAFTAEVDTVINDTLSEELVRCTKKDPPLHLKYSLIYTRKEECYRNLVNEQEHPCESPSPLQVPWTDLNGREHARIFIGHATSQRTGMGGHMASHFIPTVERESIDLTNMGVSVWNKELLYIGGLLSRVVYEFELSEIQESWKKEPHSWPSRELQDQLDKHFLHVLEFFTFRDSDPSPQVAQLLKSSFYGCSTLPLRHLSSVGVLRAPDVRAFDAVVNRFLKSLPMLSEYVMRYGKDSLAALPDQHKVPLITPSDVLRGLSGQTLDVDQLGMCLRWWIASTQNELTSNPNNLLNAVTFRGASGTMCLSSITCFIDPTILGPNGIPLDGPLPPSVIHPDISKQFSSEVLRRFHWEEFTVVSWLEHISRSDVMSANEHYDLTRSVKWAGCVLRTLCHTWFKLSEGMQSRSKKVLEDKPCIPTSGGLCRPGCSYLPSSDADDAMFQWLNLPRAGHNSEFKIDENMKEFLPLIGVQQYVPAQLVLHKLGELVVDDVTIFIIRYLVQVERFLTPKDRATVKKSKIFAREDFHGTQDTRYCADQLYPPEIAFRKLKLPTIRWNAPSEWSHTSREAQLLYSLGLNRFPPLPTIIDLCSSTDVVVQEVAFKYLCDNLLSRYQDYKKENFSHVEFIPAESNGATCLKRVEEAYSGAQWRALGFPIVQNRFPSALWRRLGVEPNPPTSKLLDLLESDPPPDRETAEHWFETLFDHIRAFSRPHLDKLRDLPIVPTGLNTPKLLPPTKCYLDAGTKSRLYKKLFVFVNFSQKAKLFLDACGLKNIVPMEDVAAALIADPKKFFDLAGGHEGFLDELRKLALQARDISNPTLHRMSNTPSLLGVRWKNIKARPGCDDHYDFLTSQEVFIVDDIDDYQLFSDLLFVAPQEKVLEDFYASLGCRRLSTVIQERCDDLHEVQDTEKCTAIQSLILHRLPLFVQKYDAKPKVAIPSSTNHLKVKACESIIVSKVLVTTNVKQRRREVRAFAKSEDDRTDLWISVNAKRSMYHDVARCLCRLLFGTNKVKDVLFLETILRKDLKDLEQRGFLVHQTSQEHGDGDAVGSMTKNMHSANRAPTPNSLQQSLLDTQLDDPLHTENPSGSSAVIVGPQLPSAHPADGISLNIHEASGKSSDTVGHSTATLPLQQTRLSTIYRTPHIPRTSHEVIPQIDIRENAEEAIHAGGICQERPTTRTDASEFLGNSFCKAPADDKDVRYLGQVGKVEVWVDKDMHDTDAFMKQKHDVLTRFVNIITTLSEVYGISEATIRVFYDTSGGCIAFNCKGKIFLNLRYFEVWHYEEVKKGNQRNAQMSWFLVLAHELAHNLTPSHDANHEFWFSAICEARLLALSRRLQPSNANAWLNYALGLGLIANVILFAYLAKCIAVATTAAR